MSQFHVVTEGAEDSFAIADNLPDAVRAAQEAARQGRAGDMVSVLESGGLAVRQFILLPDGSVAEQPIARRVNPSPGAAGSNGAGPVAEARRPHE